MKFVIMKSAYTPFFVKAALPIKKGDVILYVKSNLLPQRLLLTPTTRSSLNVILILCELLFTTEPSNMALVYCIPNAPPPDNISLICTLKTIISRRSYRVVFGDFNHPKIGFQIPPHQIQLISNFLNCKDTSNSMANAVTYFTRRRQWGGRYLPLGI